MGKNQMDTYWDAFDVMSYEDFQNKFLHPIYLKDEVHEDVKESFRVIGKLLEFGYFEHRFFDVAYSKAILTLEMAFKQRYKELKGQEWQGDLGPLMSWLTKQGYFDVYNKHFMEGMRIVRNHFAHPTTGGFAGAGQKHLVRYPMDLINGLYENPELTRKRIKTGKIFFKMIEAMGPGFKIRFDEEYHFAFNIWLSFFDNKSSPHKIHIYIQPVFDIPEPYVKGGKFDLSPFYHWEASYLAMDDDFITLRNNSGRTLEIQTISCEVEKQAFLEWLNRYNDFDRYTGDKVLRTTFASDTFAHHLRQFHRV
jgi:hypothetical protein